MTDNLPLWQAARDEAIARAHENAPKDWRARALIAVYELAKREPSFIVDRLWDFIEKPREPRAAGGVMLDAARRGWIVRTSEYRNSEQDTTHGNPRVVWNSNLYERRAA